MQAPPNAGQQFIDAVTTKQFEAVREMLSPDVAVRALLPRGFEEHQTRDPFVGRIRDWFEDKPLDLLASSVEPVADRWRISYRFRTQISGAPAIVEQQLFCAFGEQGIERVDLLCTGFRTVEEPGSGPVTKFDAGDLGCGDGLARVFREQLAAVPAGGRIEVTTRDPAARADLPPLARMMGHTVLEVRDGAAGEIVVIVEKAK